MAGSLLLTEMIVKPDLLTPVKFWELSPCGFHTLSPEERKARARRGGLASQKSPKGHKFTPSETHRGGVIRGAQQTLQKRARRPSD